MSVGVPDLEILIRRCVAAMAATDDVAVVKATVELTQARANDVIATLLADILRSAHSWPDSRLARCSSRRIPSPGVVHATVAAIRGNDATALIHLAGDDPIALMVHLAATRAALMEPGDGGF